MSSAWLLGAARGRVARISYAAVRAFFGPARWPCHRRWAPAGWLCHRRSFVPASWLCHRRVFLSPAGWLCHRRSFVPAGWHARRSFVPARWRISILKRRSSAVIAVESGAGGRSCFGGCWCVCLASALGRPSTQDPAQATSSMNLILKIGPSTSTWALRIPPTASVTLGWPLLTICRQRSLGIVVLSRCSHLPLPGWAPAGSMPSNWLIGMLPNSLRRSQSARHPKHTRNRRHPPCPAVTLSPSLPLGTFMAPGMVGGLAPMMLARDTTMTPLNRSRSLSREARLSSTRQYLSECAPIPSLPHAALPRSSGLIAGRQGGPDTQMAPGRRFLQGDDGPRPPSLPLQRRMVFASSTAAFGISGGSPTEFGHWIQLMRTLGTPLSEWLPPARRPTFFSRKKPRGSRPGESNPPRLLRRGRAGALTCHRLMRLLALLGRAAALS